MIERELVVQMFEEMQSEGVNTDLEMVWGYYFTDSNVDKLESAVPSLEERGFEFVEMLETEPEDGEDKFFILHMERVESHNVDSLDKLNQELESFAAELGLESYDGMDVAPFDDDLPEEECEDEDCGHDHDHG